MIQVTRNFLDLALDDYLAARLLLRQGLLPQGAAVAATAVEKTLKAALALTGTYTKSHLDRGLLSLVRKAVPGLRGDALSDDFIKFLARAFQLRYASTDGPGFNIVINQHRTLLQLDITMLTVDSGFRLKQGDKPADTPMQAAVKARSPMLFQDNVPLGGTTIDVLRSRPNKMYEIRVGRELRTVTATYETEGLNVIGSFCKATDIGTDKQQWQLALG